MKNRPHFPSPSLLDCLTELRERLQQSLGDATRVILFGSQARGEATSESDVDVLVVLPILSQETLDVALDIAWEVGFSHGMVISVIPATEDELEKMTASPFFQAVRREGVVV